MSAGPRMRQSFRNGLPAYGKVLLLQGVVVASFAFWLLKEYQNNRYLQEYIRGRIPMWLSLPEVAASLAFLVLGAGMLARSRSLKQRARQIAQADKLTPVSSMFAGSQPDIRTPSAASAIGDRSASPPAKVSAFAAFDAENVGPPVLKLIESPPGLNRNPSAPKPFPVILRIEPPEEPFREREQQPATTESILKRIAPTHATLPSSPMGSVRRIGSVDETSGRPLVWKSRPTTVEAWVPGTREKSLIQTLPVTEKEKRPPGTEGKTARKRSGEGRPGQSQSSPSEQAG